MPSINDLMMHEKPLFTGALSAYPHDPKLIKKYQFLNRFGEPVRMWEGMEGGKLIGLPRGLCPISDDDQRVLHTPITFDIKMKPRNSDQQRCIDEAVDLLDAGQSFILKAGTGWGKTAVATRIIGEVGQPTLVVVPKDDLMGQWRDELMKFLNLKPHEVGLVQQNKFDVAGKKVVVGMLHSLVLEGRYPAWLNKAFGLCVFDEVHRLGAETFSRACRIFNSKLRLGLSATVERADGNEVVFMAHIGPIRVNAVLQMLVPKVLRFKTNWACPRVMKYKADGTKSFIRLPHEPGKVTHIIKSLCQDNNRNKLICEAVLAAYQKGRKTVVFSELGIENHLSILRAIFVSMGVPDKDIAYFVGGMNAAQREAACVKPIMLATYKMMSEGTNFPWLDTCALTTPRSDVDQIVGRIRREYPDKKEPIVLDFVDEDSPVFSGYASRRAQWYAKIGAKVIRMN